MRTPKGLFILSDSAYRRVYAPEAAALIEARVDVIAPPVSAEALRDRMPLLADIDVLFSGWGCPRIDDAFLMAAPHLKAIFYGAGTVAYWATPAVWERDIVVTTASSANARPVAEYTVATVLFSLKQGWRRARETRSRRDFGSSSVADVPGNYGSVIGLISMGLIARIVVELLRPYAMTILAYDPFLSEADASALGVTKASLEEVFARSDVVSLHAPEIAATRGMVTGALLRSMHAGATFINTSRGSIVKQAEMIDVLRERPDLQAVLDVADGEPPAADSPLYDLPNVVLTPHIAGSQGRECSRMGLFMAHELDRYLAGQPLHYRIHPSTLLHTAHAAGAR